MELASLCEYCSKINFDALRLPLIADIETLRQGKATTGSLFFQERNAEGLHKLTDLGYLTRIQRDSQDCRLCCLIKRALARAGYSPTGLTPGNEEIECSAETNFYGLFRHPTDDNKHFWLRRLSVIARPNQDDLNYGSHFCFQACDVGAASVQSDQISWEPSIADANGGDKFLFSGRKRPLLLNLNWVSSWLDICEQKHGNRCHPRMEDEEKRTVPLIRFIDVRQKAIVSFTNRPLSSFKFVALSYVWGAAQKFTLTSSNIDELASAGALQSDLVSKTITDAIYLAERLGAPFVWVDACCIMQDSLDDKKAQIASMGMIYNTACLTIIAASGEDADAGLPGIRPHTRILEQEEILIRTKSNPASASSTDSGHLSLMTTLNPLKFPGHHYLEGTTWNSRGWTMQERVLSRRVLVFTQEQVFWVCNEATFCEESYLEHSSKFIRFHGSALESTLQRSFRNFYESEDPEDRFWAQYQDLVKRFTRRNFTYDGDFHDGFSGILQALAKLPRQEFLWGLPRRRLELGLSWGTFTGQVRRGSLSTLPMTKKNVQVPFPSWSWMGWVGEAWVSVGNDRAELGYRPEITCFIHQTSPLRLSKPTFLSDYEAGRQGDADPNDNEEYDHGDEDVDIYASTQSNSVQEQHSEAAAFSLQPSWRPDGNDSISLKRIRRHLPHLGPTRLREIPDEQLLFFWTSSATFTVKHHGFDITQAPPSTLDKFGAVVGEMDVEGEDSPQGETSPDLDKREFVVIGSDRKPLIPDIKPVLVALSIKWEKGIAYRTNLARIEEVVWLDAEPCWKLIALG